MLLVVAWFCACGSSVRMSFCAAHLSSLAWTALTETSVADMPKASASKRVVRRMGFNMQIPVLVG